MKTALYLDDVRTPTNILPGHKPWDVVRSYQAFVDYITKHGVPDFISFDHDLADEHMNDYYQQVANAGFQNPDYESFQEKTGLHCAMWLVEHAQTTGAVINNVSVHSHNPVGARNIQDCINSWKKYLGEPQNCFIMRHPHTLNDDNA